MAKAKGRRKVSHRGSLIKLKKTKKGMVNTFKNKLNQVKKKPQK